MRITIEIARHFRQLYFGGNWTCVNMKQTLQDVSWKEATMKTGNFNTIATLCNHMAYYVRAQLAVLKGGKLEAKDELSFEQPPINNEQDWQHLLEQMWKEAEAYAVLVEQLPDAKLMEVFEDKKYGTWYRNLQGLIEHNHYHLGQISLLKKKIKNS